MEAHLATSEAVEILRRLAASRPGTFLPDLAVGLANLGKELSALKRRAEAVKAEEQAIQILAPFFKRLPEAFEEKMRICISYYHELATDAGHSMDHTLLGPILGELERLVEKG